MFWKKKKVEQQEPDPQETIQEEQPEKKEKLYSLEGILLFDNLKESKYKYLIEKKEEILDQMEKTDPYDLPENVSDDRYDRVADRYYYLSNQFHEYNEATELFEILGPQKGGYKLNIFDNPIRMRFTYQKTREDISERDVNALRFEFAQGSLCIVAVEIGNDIEKHFALYKIHNLTIGEESIKNIKDYLVLITNKKIAKLIESKKNTV